MQSSPRARAPRRPFISRGRKAGSVAVVVAVIAGLTATVSSALLAQQAGASEQPSVLDDIYTVAGTGAASHANDSAQATTSALDDPEGVLVDPSGNIYIADTANNRVQEIPATSGTQWGIAMTAGDAYTVVGSASGNSGASANGAGIGSSLLDHPEGLALDSAGDLLIADTGNNRVVMLAAATCSSSCPYGLASTTQYDTYTIIGSGLSGPSGLAFDSSGDLYIANSGANNVQEMAATAHTQWGTAMTANDVYTIISSGLSGPSGLAFDPFGDLYIADTGDNRVQEMAATNLTQWGVVMTANDVYTVAGSGLSGPSGLAFDSSGDLYIADTGDNRVQEVAATNQTQWGITMTANDVYTVAGSGTDSSGYSGDGGLSTSALLSSPYAIAVSASGDLYIADSGNNRVREVADNADPTTVLSYGDLYTMAGTGSAGTNDDLAQATSSEIDNPDDVVVDPEGNVYIADTDANRVQEIPAITGTQWGISMTAGDAYTVVGSATGASGVSANGVPAGSARLDHPEGLALDPEGDLLIADTGNNRVVMLAAADCSSSCPYGLVPTTKADTYTIAGSVTGGPQAYGYTGDGGSPMDALLNQPTALAVDSSGDLYIADTGNNRVQAIFANASALPSVNQTFDYAGSSAQNWPVPANIHGTTVNVVVTGAGGSGGGAGPGAAVSATVPVSAGQVLSIYAAGQGGWGFASGADSSGGSSAITDSSGNILAEAAGGNGSQQTASFGYTGGAQSWTPPDVVGSTVAITLTAGGGASGCCVNSSGGGVGGEVSATVPVQAGQPMTIYVGGAGSGADPSTSSAPGGWGFTSGGNGGYLGGAQGGGGGGGSSAIVVGSGLYMLAAGGGGGGGNGYAQYPYSAAGGAAGAPNGASGGSSGTAAGYAYGGSGASQSADGGGGYFSVGSDDGGGVGGSGGNTGTGGNGGADGTAGGGGGGAGYYGGGGGGAQYGTHGGENIPTAFSAGGGGGSSVAASGLANVSYSTDGSTGNGSASVTYTPAGSGSNYAESSATNVSTSAASSPAGGSVEVTYTPAAVPGDIYTVAGSASGTGGDSGDDGSATYAFLAGPTGVAVDPSGDLYIADTANNRIQEVPVAPGQQWGQSMTAGDMYTIAGTGTAGSGGDDGAGTSAQFNGPAGLAVDPTGDVYVADTANSRVQELAAITGAQWGQSMAQGDIYTVAGTGSAGSSGQGGPPGSAQLDQPVGVTTDLLGNVYVADTGNDVVDELLLDTPSNAIAPGGPDQPGETIGGTNPSEPNDPQPTLSSADVKGTGVSVDAATGELDVNVQDLSVPGRGEPLDLTRTYSSTLATTESSDDECSSASQCPYGWGWTGSYNMGLFSVSSGGPEEVAAQQENGSEVTFVQTSDVSCGWTTAERVQATLCHESNGDWQFTRGGTENFTFYSTGQLYTESDLNGYTTTLAYNSANQLTTVTGPAGRTFIFSYFTSGPEAGLLEEVTDPAGRTTQYAYDSAGDLTQVTDVGGGTTTYAYNSSHQLTSVTDPLGNTTSFTYNSSGQVTAETGPTGAVTRWSYSLDTEGSGTVTTTDPTGIETYETLYEGEPTAITDAYGTSSAATTRYQYFPGTDGTRAVTNPDGDTTVYTYNPAGDLIEKVEPMGNTWAWTYNNLNEVTSSQSPLQMAAGVATIYTYDGDGNIQSESDPLPGGGTATTTYGYGQDCSTTGGNNCYTGDIESMTDPDGNVTDYGYDQYGDVTSVTTGVGTKYQAETTYGYDNSQGNNDMLGEVTSVVKPDGNAEGDPGNYTYSYKYDAYGDVISVTSPVPTGGTEAPTEAATYDDLGDQVCTVDQNEYANGVTCPPAGHAWVPGTTAYSYNADGELADVTHPDGTTTSTTYNLNGEVIGSTNNSIGGDIGQAEVGNPISSTYTNSAGNEELFLLAGGGTSNSSNVVSPSTMTSEDETANVSTSVNFEPLTGTGTTDLGLSWAPTTNYRSWLAVALKASSAGGATHVQEIGSSSDNGSGDVTLSLPVTQATAAGDTVLVTVSTFTPATTSVTDSAGNKYNLVATGPGGVYLYGAQNANSLPANGTITVTVENSHYGASAIADEWADLSLDADNTTTYAYDSLGNRFCTVTPVEAAGGATCPASAPQSPPSPGDDPYDGATVTITDGAGLEKYSTDPMGNTTSYSYNNDGELTTTDYPDGTWTTLGYDPDGNETSSTDSAGDETTYTYNYLDELTSQTVDTSPSETTTYAYDDDGQRFCTVAPKEYADGVSCPATVPSGPYPGATIDVYDATGQVVEETDPLGDTSSYLYDADGNKISYTNGDTETTSYSYNNLDQLIAQEDPDHNSTLYTYYPNGLLETKTDPQGRVTTTGYNVMGQVTSVTYSDGDPSESYSYYPSGTEAGLLESTTDASGTTNYSYDLDGRTTSISGPGGTVSYSYNDDSQLASLTYPNGKAVTFGYTAGDETSLTDWLGNKTKFNYDTAGRLATTTLPNGIGESTNYDNDSEVSSISADNGGTTLASFTYTRDPDEDVTEEQDSGTPGTPGPTSTAYTYDSANRLYTAGNSSFAYDDASQLTIGPSGATQQYDPAGQLCLSEVDLPSGSACGSPPSGATAYTYDEEGERTGSTGPSGTSTYGWDQAGDLTSVTTTTGSASYTYNAQGLLASATEAGQTSNMVWDPVEDPTAPLLLDDGSNYYVYGPDQLPVEQISVASGTPYYYVHDQLGSTRMLTSSTGSVARSYTYNAWGQTIATGGGSLTGNSATIVPIGYMALTQSSSTISMSPLQTGDLVVLSVMGPGGTPQVASVSGGGVSNWSKAVAYQDTSGGYDDEIWWGVVSSPGPSTATVTWTGTAPSWDDLAAQEFSGGAGATWSVDTSGGDVGSGWTVPFASLAPSTDSGELYIGGALTSGYAQPEDTPGYTYQQAASGDEFIYNTDVTSTSAPAMGQYPSSGASLTASALFIASGGEPTVPITDVGDLGTYSGYVGSSSTTLAVSPETVGDVEVLGVVNDTWATTVSSVSGGGVSNWQPAGPVYYDGGDAQMLQYWYGTVTSAGSSTITVDWSGAINNAQLSDEELSAGVGATWSVNDLATSTSPFPSLSAPVSDEAYVGMAFAWGDAASGGTAGVNYNVVSSDFMTAVDTSFSGTLSPAGTGSGSLAVLVTASAPSGPTTPLLWAGQYQDPATGLYYMRARWYDPSTGQFLSVDPDFDQTLEAYSYASEDPVDAVDPTGMMIDVAGNGGYGVSTCSISRSVCQTASTAQYLGVGYFTVAKATTKQIDEAMANAQKAAVVLGQDLAQVQVAAKAVTTAQVAYHIASVQYKTASNTSQAASTSLTASQDMEKALSAADNLSVAVGAAEVAADRLANASDALQPPSALDEVMKWGGVALGAVGTVTGGISDIAGAIGYAALAETLGGYATAAGLGATAVDFGACLHGSDTACFTAGLGAVATAGSAFAARGAGLVASGTVRDFDALAIAAQASGFFSESFAVTSLVIDSEMAALAQDG